MTTSRKATFTTLVRANPERVYDALATAEGLDGWFTKGASVQAKPAGNIIFRWKNWGLEGYTGENGGPVGTQDLMNRQSGWAEALTLMKFFVEHGVRY